MAGKPVIEGEKIPKKVFIAYSKMDVEHLKTLQNHLSSLDRNQELMTWHDGDIRPGEEWDEQIKAALKEADIVLLLVSSDFLATDYIHEIELEIAEKQRENGKAVIVPIIVRPCLWYKTGFGKYQVLPADGGPITNWKNEDEAWLSVVEGIAGMLEG